MTVSAIHSLIFAWAGVLFVVPAVRPVLNVLENLQTLQLLPVKTLPGLSLPILAINVLPAEGLYAAPVEKNVKGELFLFTCIQAALPSQQ